MVRWVVSDDRSNIRVEKKSDGAWNEYGELDVIDSKIVSESFDDDRWTILEYTESTNETYRLVVTGPKEVDRRYIYHLKIKKLVDDEFETIDDSLLNDMPDLETRS